MDCGTCKTYTESLKRGRFLSCHESGFFAPSESRFCRPQIMIYIEHAETFRSGSWIPEPNGSSYTDPSIRSKAVKIPSKAAEELAAEMDSRLKMIPEVETALLIEQVTNHKTFEELSKYSKQCVNFLSGFRRRITFCPNCNGVTIMTQSRDTWTQTCEKCGESWGHYTFSHWKADRNRLDKKKQSRTK